MVGSNIIAFLLGSIALASVVKAAEPVPGQYAIRSDGEPVMMFELKAPVAPGGRWMAVFAHPRQFQFAGIDPIVFLHLKGPADADQLSGRRAGEDIELTGAAGPSQIWVWHQTGEHAGELSTKGYPSPPLMFTSARRGEAVAADWDSSRAYLTDGRWASNAEMAAIFDADQADRRGSPIDWSKVGPRDTERRARTRELLDAGKLQSGSDLYEAALVLQHGTQLADYLLAHSLALAAMMRGRPDASWIATATLDRYLTNTGQKQIYGTQIDQPVQPNLIPDVVRRALGVPSMSAAKQELRLIQKQAGASQKD